LILGGITLYAPYAFLADRIKERGKAVDRELPLAISRLCAGILAGGSVSDVLEEVGKSLEGEKTIGLASELRLAASDLRTKDRGQALTDLAARSPSLSLANLAFLLEGYLEVGGGKYTRILVEASAQLQRVLAARNRTRAKAGDAMLSARIIPLVLAFVIASLSRDPMVHQTLSSLPIQGILGLTIAAMAGGYLIMRSMVSEAV
jgi:pilus assembly protein TadC